MHFIWDSEGISIPNCLTVKTEGQQVGIVGTALKGSTLYTFYALATQHDWFVEITSWTGRRETFQGTTFNLPLEVATALGRTL